MKSFAEKEIQGQGKKQLINPLFPLVKKDDPYRKLKLAIWIYFLLLIFEGALRKWVLPGLSTPLLLVRDPVGIWLVIVCWKKGLLPSNRYLNGMVVLGVIGIILALIFGHGNLFVALYGARIMFVHFPLIFIIGQIFSHEDVLKMGKAFLLLAIPMAVLTALQFYSPQSAWVNRGIGGDMEGAGFSGAMGYYRPPGTFSFTTGNVMFFSTTAAFIFYFWLKPKFIKPLFLIAATAALLAAIPLSISRSLFFAVAISTIFAAMLMWKDPRYLGRMLLIGMGGGIILMLLTNLPFFGTATEVMNTRFERSLNTEGGVEGTLVDRFLLGGMLSPIINMWEQPFFGHGIGIGTSAGNKMMTGERGFGLSEGEWGRLIGEMGPLFGLAVILIRVALVAFLGLKAYKEAAYDNLLPWMLLSFGMVQISTAQWGTATTLGFSVLAGGLIVAAFKKPRNLPKPKSNFQ